MECEARKYVGVEGDNEIDGTRHAPPPTSKEQELERIHFDGLEKDGVPIVSEDGPRIRRARAPRHTSEEKEPLLRQHLRGAK